MRGDKAHARLLRIALEYLALPYPRAMTRRFTLRDLTGDPLDRLVTQLCKNTTGIAGGQAVVRAMLEAALGRPCPYCGKRITLDTAGLDHKDPCADFGGRRVPLTLRRVMNRPENLQIVCRQCNGDKGDMSDAEFRTLLALPFFPKLRRRLAAAKSFWRGRR